MAAVGDELVRVYSGVFFLVPVCVLEVQSWTKNAAFLLAFFFFFFLFFFFFVFFLCFSLSLLSFPPNFDGTNKTKDVCSRVYSREKKKKERKAMTAGAGAKQNEKNTRR